MKEKELRELSTCGLCNKKLGQTGAGLGLFYKVTVERFMLDPGACSRQTGLGMMIGAQIAAVMGADEDLAKAVMTPITMMVCEDCAYEDRSRMLISIALERSAASAGDVTA